MQQLSLFDGVHETPPKIELAELFEAYAKCRSNKRNTANALAFEVDYESKLLALCDEINNGSYQPGKSIAFIVTQPVKREIFAADFRDRVVHHLVVGKLNSKKIYLQHNTKGVQFLGVVINPNRIYIANRTKSNFYLAIQKQNTVVEDTNPDKEQQAAFLSSMNTYPGIMKHYKTHRLRKRMLMRHLSFRWWNAVYLSGGVAKFVLKVKPVKRGAWPFL